MRRRKRLHLRRRWWERPRVRLAVELVGATLLIIAALACVVLGQAA